MAEEKAAIAKSLVQPTIALRSKEIQVAQDRTTVSACRLKNGLKFFRSKNKRHTDPAPNSTSPLPLISAQRLEASLHNNAFKDEADIIAVEEKQQTVLYLAYGSNLCYETFQGRRGIRPIAQMNVVVPTLRMTFDLPGIAYAEPCFANSALRDQSLPPTEGPNQADYHKDRWKKGMVGVVYEVTPSDYAHIIATEGGGSSYQDILVDCHHLTSTVDVPEIPATAAFKAHTLFAPAIPPTEPGQPPPSTGGRFQRPDPSYAQASARYLKLITDGADEHNLPQEYKDYLHRLRPYEITTQGQRLGQFVFLSFWTPFFMLLFALMQVYQDEQGRTPKWLTSLVNAVFTSAWNSYDDFFKPTFGDGERTDYNHRDGRRRRCRRDDQEWADERDDDL